MGGLSFPHTSKINHSLQIQCENEAVKILKEILKYSYIIGVGLTKHISNERVYKSENFNLKKKCKKTNWGNFYQCLLESHII